MRTTTFCTLSIGNATRRASLSYLAVGVAILALLMAAPVRADIEEPIVEPIHVTVGPGQTIPFFFGEQTDFIHYKTILFEGIAQTVPGAVATLDVQFDWYDPMIGAFQYSPHFPIQVIGGAPNPFSLPWVIPYCPPEVSLHLTNIGDVTAVPIQVDGTFTYQCVPEPSTVVMLGSALLVLGGHVLMRRRSRVSAAC